MLSDLVLNKIQYLDNIGRKNRSNKNENLENFLTDLQRLTIVHETDHGGSYYRFASGAVSPTNEEEDTPGKAKDAKTRKDVNDAKKSDTGRKGQALDGDKG
jgi:H+-transporting ATPase